MKHGTGKKDAAKVVSIETAMATPRLDRVERRDRRKNLQSDDCF
ncbi:hypothetical protein QW060_27805 [Myroides ceti]|uniref:Uncharacterized protein n=1 Tax=Paenimyroides ceti TaxID=395087 RepID=A0ABT8D5S9_9FLAO|nr:hypothetical protein [Paenimyroides ceti]MDN3710589.1 hypothetical protein [Paenimyroides ceti]